MFTRGFCKTAVSLAAYQQALGGRIARVAKALAEAKKKKISLPKQFDGLKALTKSDISVELAELAKKHGLGSYAAAEKAPARKFFSGELASAWPKRPNNQAVLKNLGDDIRFVSKRLRGADKEISDYVNTTAYERTVIDRARDAAPLEAAAKLQNANRAAEVKRLADEAKSVQEAGSKNSLVRNYVLGGLGLAAGGTGIYSYRNKVLQERRDEALRAGSPERSASINSRTPGSALISESFE